MVNIFKKDAIKIELASEGKLMKKKVYLLGIDIGGTGAKAGVFSLDGTLVGSG